MRLETVLVRLVAQVWLVRDVHDVNLENILGRVREANAGQRSVA